MLLWSVPGFKCQNSDSIELLPAIYRPLQCSALLAQNEQKSEFIDYIKEEYEEIRNDYFDNLKDKSYLSLAESRKRKLVLDWSNFKPGKLILDSIGKPVTLTLTFSSIFLVEPQFIGKKTLKDVDLHTLVPYIDWKPFFDVWQLRGKYPNRGYPKIFNDANVGELP